MATSLLLTLSSGAAGIVGTDSFCHQLISFLMLCEKELGATFIIFLGPIAAVDREPIDTCRVVIGLDREENGRLHLIGDETRGSHTRSTALVLKLHPSRLHGYVAQDEFPRGNFNLQGWEVRWMGWQVG